MSSCEYAQNYYGVPACIGRGVVVDGQPGVIAADRGHYIGVNFDSDKPGVISNCHPTWKVEYGEMRPIRKPSRFTARYNRYLEYGDSFSSFIEFCRWDADPAHSWNGGRSA